MSDDGSFLPLFDGVSLAGWHTAPRVYGSVYPGGPSVLEHFDSLGLPRPVEPEKHPARWKVGGVGAQCRWRNIRIKELPAGPGEASQ